MASNYTARDIDFRLNALNAHLPFPPGFGLKRTGSYGKTHIVLEQFDNGAEHASVIRMATKREAYESLELRDWDSILNTAWKEYALTAGNCEFTFGLIHGCIQATSDEYYNRALSMTSERFNIAYQRISVYAIGAAIHSFWKLARIYTA
jgi:hypothetical protein